MEVEGGGSGGTFGYIQIKGDKKCHEQGADKCSKLSLMLDA